MKYKTPYYESKRGKDGLFHFLYKTTNILNNKFYIGVHTTDDLGDGYKGSGSTLNKAFKKYGKNNFNREILEFFETYEDAYNKERDVVNEELINNPNCYNNVIGGKGNSPGIVIARDNVSNHTIIIPKEEFDNNDRYESVNKGTIPVWNNIKNKFERIFINDYDETIHSSMNKGKIVVYNIITCQYEQVDVNDVRRKTGELISPSKNKVTVYDEFGNCIQVDKDCTNYKTGKYKPITYNKWTLRNKITKECISVPKNSIVDWNVYEFASCRSKKIDNPNIKKGRLLGDKKYKWYDINDERFQTLDLFIEMSKGSRNVYYTNEDKTMDVVLHPNEIDTFLKYHPNWTKGHKKYNYKSGVTMSNRCWVNNGIENKTITKDEIDDFLLKNPEWKRGCLFKKTN